MTFFYRRPLLSQCCESLHRPDGDRTQELCRRKRARCKEERQKGKVPPRESCRWFCSSNFSATRDLYFSPGRWKLIIGGERDMVVFLSVIYSTQQSEARNENVSFPSTPESALYIFWAQRAEKNTNAECAEADLNTNCCRRIAISRSLPERSLAFEPLLTSPDWNSCILGARCDFCTVCLLSRFSFHHLCWSVLGNVMILRMRMRTRIRLFLLICRAIIISCVMTCSYGMKISGTILLVQLYFFF